MSKQATHNPTHRLCQTEAIAPELQRVIEARDKHGRTPLIEAASSANLKVIEALLKAGAAINACDDLACPKANRDRCILIEGDFKATPGCEGHDQAVVGSHNIARLSERYSIAHPQVTIKK